ncbi:hypothetical protein BO78DRAFT_324704 [Aspergillus sclerotiicarbonarius CBS 121057]|uniref:Uncharacterized protein n=1 Tax=Aspergillus sclerotiicarbonarius (strain CBS 121057 / IBT 28362) TaxID=1448318 RepID=A0A319EFI7_ASPSB|nr:hypothetical protein BO78DRAFT_324704 [Aspergillus sclerotiicarbonarius CBS 121057]
MSASSGRSGFCDICSHANNEHTFYACTARGCRNEFKICQTGSHQEFNVDGKVYVLCDWCLDHPYSCIWDVTSMPRLKR